MIAPQPIAITGGRVICPASGHDGVATILLQDRVVASIGQFEPPSHAVHIDARGLVVAPGIIDVGVFRAHPPACHAGGITRVVLMPDQSPPLDDPALVAYAQGSGKPDVWVHPLAAATRGLLGEELAEIGLAQAAGAVGVATGRGAIADARVMHRLLAYARAFGLTVVAHAEDPALTAGAVATAGEYATRLGLAAAPAFAEAMAITRDCRLAQATGAALHIRQVTTAEGLAAVAAARHAGVDVTAGITPAHLLLNDMAVSGFRSFARLSPPLRDERDRLAAIEGVRSGIIDILASGHDPQSQEDKRQPFADARAGMAGAQTLLALGLGLVRDGVIDLPRLIAMLSWNPARRFGLVAGTLQLGAPADLVVFDEHAPWRIDGRAFEGAGNTPFDGLPTFGRVRITIKGGELVWQC
ncbi:amidohydrolase family protein [Sandarakinorhabdus sp.]|uniref:dihydroorotase n=1 Tax=Sandarakinorhabdus sp. TaxID=1916663 RepID=UPI00334164BD